VPFLYPDPVLRRGFACTHGPLGGPGKDQAFELFKRPGQLVFAAIDGLLAGRPFPQVAAAAGPRATTHADAAAELRVHCISKSFDAVPVLRDISMTVAAGEFVTILGPSGCGKTTLLRIIAGLEMADRGRVELCGRPITDLAANRRPVNTVFQNYALFPHLSVRENVAFGLRARRFPTPEIDQRVGDALQMVQMEALGERYPGQLSGGQKQRVALARALVNEPEVLLLDEPMSALDAKLRAEVQLELRRLQRRLGKTFILVTHDQDEAMTVSDRVLVMRDGQIEQSGTPADVYERPVSRFVAEFLGSANLIPATREGEAARTGLGLLQVDRPPTWEEGTLAIRPERVGVCRQRPERNAVCGRVRELVYRGDHMDLFVDPGPLRVRTTARGDLHVGDAVWLELRPEYLVPLRD
jgi:spermidine/putrescine transport system ATP-binding protein